MVDHRALNPEFGGEAGFARLSAALKDAGLGLILDFVPNHMAVGSGNAWWMDVLEWGQKSPRAAAFDISWELLPYRPGGGVLLPVLGKPYGEALTGGEIALRYDAADRQLLGLVFRPALSDQSAPLCRHHQDRGGGGAGDGTSRPDVCCSRLPTPMRGRAGRPMRQRRS